MSETEDEESIKSINAFSFEDDVEESNISERIVKDVSDQNEEHSKDTNDSPKLDIQNLKQYSDEILGNKKFIDREIYSESDDISVFVTSSVDGQVDHDVDESNISGEIESEIIDDDFTEDFKDEALMKNIDSEEPKLQENIVREKKETIKRKKIIGTRRRIPSHKFLSQRYQFLPDYQEYQLKSDDLKKEEKYVNTSSIYLDTNYDHKRIDSFSLESIYPPQSWPFDANLVLDSDVYPEVSLEDEKQKEMKTEHTRLPEQKPSVFEIITDDEDDDLSKASFVTNYQYDEKENKSETIEQEGILKESEKLNYEITDEGYIEKSKKEKEKIEEGIPYLKEIPGIDFPINEKYREKISFVETLIISQDIVSDEQKQQHKLKHIREGDICKCPFVEIDNILEIGGLSLSIESDSNKFITFCTSQFSCKNGVGGSKLLAITKKNLKLIEEKKTEWHLMLHDKIEKALHVVKEKDNFIAFRTQTKNEITERDRGTVTIKYTGDLVLDGGIFILMRYLILKKFKGKIKTWSMNISGDLCKCVLDVGKCKIFYIQDKPYKTIGIRKILYSENSDPIISKTYFLPSGHILRHTWNNSKIFFHMNPFTTIPIPRKCVLNLQKNWKDDVMLVSKYLDFKASRKSEIETYIGDNPEFKSMLKDFVLATIMQKPSDVLDFAIEYFLNVCGDE